MRRAIILVIATAMVIGGGYLLFLQFTSSTMVSGKLVFGGAVLVVGGIALLWEDIIAPLFRNRT